MLGYFTDRVVRGVRAVVLGCGKPPDTIGRNAGAMDGGGRSAGRRHTSCSPARPCCRRNTAAEVGAAGGRRGRGRDRRVQGVRRTIAPSAVDLASLSRGTALATGDEDRLCAPRWENDHAAPGDNRRTPSEAAAAAGAFRCDWARGDPSGGRCERRFDRLPGPARRALLRLRGAVERGGAAGHDGRKLRLRRTVQQREPDDRQGDDSAGWLPRKGRLHVLPGPVAALEPRLRRARCQRRDEPLQAAGDSRRQLAHHRCGSAPRASRLRRPHPGARARPLYREHRSTAGPLGAVGLWTVAPDRTAQRAAARGAVRRPPEAAPGRCACVGGRDTVALPPLRPRSRLEDYEAQRVAHYHANGLAVLSYVNPMLCASYEPRFTSARTAGALLETAAGTPALFASFVGGTGPAGFSIQQ